MKRFTEESGDFSGEQVLLPEAAHLFDAVVESLSAHVAVLDEMGRIVAVNQAWLRFAAENDATASGVGPGTDYLEVCRRASRDSGEVRAFMAGLEDVLAGRRESFEQQYPCHSPTEERWYQVWVSRCDQGGVSRIIVSHQDITRLKLAEQAAHRYQSEMAHMLRLGMMNEMAGGLAHELSQPLSAIVNFASGSVRFLQSGTNDRQLLEGALQDIIRQAERASEILKRMSGFVRSTEGSHEAGDINHIVMDALSLHHPDSRTRNVAIRPELQRDLPPALMDGVQIQQVVLNLIRNGVEAMAGHAGASEQALIIRTSKTDEGCVRVQVLDAGPGVPQEDLERIFEPFFTTKSSGMGLGLALSRSIIRAHEGNLTATPNTPSGMIFEFTLPPIDGVHDAD